MKTKKVLCCLLFLSITICCVTLSADSLTKQQEKQQELEEMQKNFTWWPTDAKPAPVKDPNRAGYWWWPTEKGEARPWGNRGYIYVYKIIFDYQEEELPAPKPKELRPSLLVKRIIKNVKVYFDYDKAQLRDDALKILKKAIFTLERNPKSSILITGNCDIRGSEQYNEKLGKRRGEAVKQYMIDNGISEDRIRIISRGKLDAIAPITDIEGMQKDRNAQFMIAEVEEVMIPYPENIKEMGAKRTVGGKYYIEEKEELEGQVKVSVQHYTVQKGDTLWKIAEKYLGSGHRWKYLYEINKDKIKDPNKLQAGTTIVIPEE